MDDMLTGLWKKKLTCEIVMFVLYNTPKPAMMTVSIRRFNVQLMKTGRMKGQGFVGLPSEAVAAQALRETNGYLLKGKPIIVVR